MAGSDLSKTKITSALDWISSRAASPTAIYDVGEDLLIHVLAEIISSRA